MNTFLIICSLFSVVNLLVVVYDIRLECIRDGEATREVGEIVGYLVLVVLSALGTLVLFIEREEAVPYIARKYSININWTGWLYKDLTICKRRVNRRK